MYRNTYMSTTTYIKDYNLKINAHIYLWMSVCLSVSQSGTGKIDEVIMYSTGERGREG